MPALTEALVPTAMAALTAATGTGISVALRRRAARRDLDDYLDWLFAELEAQR